MRKLFYITMQLLHYADAVMIPCNTDSFSVLKQSLSVSAASVQEEDVVELRRTKPLNLLVYFNQVGVFLIQDHVKFSLV